MPEPSLNPESGLFGKGVAVESGAVQAGGQTLVFDVPPSEEGGVKVEKAATKRLGVFGWCALIWLFLVVFGAVFAPVLPIADPNQNFLLHINEAPSLAHPMGTDGTGRDMFSRVIWGARASLVVSVSATMFGLVIGGILGLLAGYYRGKLDTFLVNIFNVFLAIPQLVLALALVAVFASDPAVSVSEREFWLIISIGIVSIPIIGRITRASALTWAQREFVLASRSMGAKNGRIMRRDVLPNVLPAMFSIAILGIAVVIVLEGGLSILGVGIPPSTPSWGNMIATGRNELTKIIGASPQVILAPSIAIFLTVLSLNYIGDVVRARFDVRESAI